MRLRSYDLRTFRRLDAVLLEDRLHQYVHSENILKRDGESEAVEVGVESESESSEKVNLTNTRKNGLLYDLLSLNEFDVEYKQIKQIRPFSRQYWLFGDELPKYKVQLLLSGEEAPLIAIHDFLVTDENYLVEGARDVTKAHWHGQTKYWEPEKIEEYHRALETYVKERLSENVNLQTVFLKGNYSHNSHLHCSRITLSGPVIQILNFRRMLRTGFKGIQVTDDEISYS